MKSHFPRQKQRERDCPYDDGIRAHTSNNRTYVRYVWQSFHDKSERERGGMKQEDRKHTLEWWSLFFFPLLRSPSPSRWSVTPNQYSVNRPHLFPICTSKTTVKDDHASLLKQVVTIQKKPEAKSNYFFCFSFPHNATPPPRFPCRKEKRMEERSKEKTFFSLSPPPPSLSDNEQLLSSTRSNERTAHAVGESQCESRSRSRRHPPPTLSP